MVGSAFAVGWLRSLVGALSLLLAASGMAHAQVAVSEVAPWSSGSSPLAADWFELTNLGSSPVTISGWKMDDNSSSFAASVLLNGIASIAPGESVIFIESSAGSVGTAFKTLWFGATPPAALQVGTYSGSGVGLGTGGDAVNIFDASGVLQANVSFGASPTGPFATFDNAAGLTGTTLSTLSSVGANGAFVAANDAQEIGSPGTIGAAPPVPALPRPGLVVLALTLTGVGFGWLRRRERSA